MPLVRILKGVKNPPLFPQKQLYGCDIQQQAHNNSGFWKITSYQPIKILITLVKFKQRIIAMENMIFSYQGSENFRYFVDFD